MEVLATVRRCENLFFPDHRAHPSWLPRARDSDVARLVQSVHAKVTVNKSKLIISLNGRWDSGAKRLGKVAKRPKTQRSKSVVLLSDTPLRNTQPQQSNFSSLVR
jgi:hypothetical protein